MIDKFVPVLACCSIEKKKANKGDGGGGGGSGTENTGWGRDVRDV